MMAQRGRTLLIAGGIVALIVISTLAALLLFDINTFKSNIESAAFEATGLEVRINGEIVLSFFPFGVSAKDIHVANKGGEIISIDTLKLGLEVLPLLKKQLNVTSCELVKPSVTIVKAADGKYNFESPEKKLTKRQPGTTFRLIDIKLSKGVLVYLDKKSDKKTEFNDFNLALKDFSIAGNVIKDASFSGSFDCKEVQQKYFRIDNIKAPVRAVKGIYNFEPLTIGTLIYVDRKSGEKIELKEINLAINNLSIVDTSGVIIKNTTFTGNLDCKDVRKRDLKIENVKSSITVENGVISLAPLTMDIFGSKGEGGVTLDKSEDSTLYKINLKVSKLAFELFEQSFGIKKVIGGKGDLFADLTIKEKGSLNLMGSLDGSFSLRGDNLVIYIMDLDKFLSSYEASQEFNLVDLGAFFIAGPLSTFAVRAYRSEELYNQTRGGQGTITHFNSHWKIKGGVADATDCALATYHNRIALKGKLDLVKQRYDNVLVALLDDKGCAKFKQSISGSFLKPQISAVSAAETIAGPFSNLYRKAKRFVQGGTCEVIYSGSVQQPPQ